MTSSFTFWDNNTIRLEGGNGIVKDFTLSYIDNNITEPVSTTYRYVTTSGSSGNSGTSEGAAWDIATAVANCTPGMTVWVKAGNYGDTGPLTFTNKIGTVSSPIKFIGYKTTPGDITTNYFDYGVTMLTSEMPTFNADVTWASTSNNECFRFRNSHYMIMRNIQTRDACFGFRGWTSNVAADQDSYLIFDNCNGENFSKPVGDQADRNFGSFISINDGSVAYRDNPGMRAINCVGINCGMTMIAFRGDGNYLIENCKVYNDNPEDPTNAYPWDRRVDYMLTINGNHSIIRNNHAENKSYTADYHSIHGIGIRGGQRGAVGIGNDYNLIERNTVINVLEGIYVRNYGCYYNVLKDNYVYGSPTTSHRDVGGMWIWGGCDYNVFERNYIERCWVAI